MPLKQLLAAAAGACALAAPAPLVLKSGTVIFGANNRGNRVQLAHAPAAP